MPYLTLKTNRDVNGVKEKELIIALSNAITEVQIPHNSGDWLMSEICDNCRMVFNRGNRNYMAYVEIKTLGHEYPEHFQKLTQIITGIISEILDISEEQIYITYTPIKSWGWNAANF